MDQIDLKILRILQKDCMVSYKEIANQVGLSYNPTYERIRKMEEEGIIQSRVTILNPSKIGIGIFVYCNVTLKEQSKQSLMDFEERVRAIPEILEVVSMSGAYDYMLKIAAQNIDAYNKFTMLLADIPNIGQYHSNIVLSTVKKTTEFPLYPKEG